MKQKFLFLCFIILLSGMFNQTYARTIEVLSLSNFSTEAPPESISVKLLEPLGLTESITINAGDTVVGDLTDVVSPKRLKRDAGFSFKPKYYIDENGNKNQINEDITASYTVPIDKGELAKNAALGVGGHFVKGLSIGVAAVEGAVKNPEDNRLKSSVVSAYESSPFSYVEKGQELEINENEYFYLKFPKIKKDNTDEQKGQNYTYTIEKE